jgi:hypothetical protein
MSNSIKMMGTSNYLGRYGSATNQELAVAAGT